MTPIRQGEDHIDVHETLLGSSNFNLSREGIGNYLKIGRPHAAVNVRIYLGGGARVVIEDGCVLGNLFIHASRGATVHIGSGVGFNGLVRLLLHESQSITIGRECLFGADVDITVSDMHSIVDAATGVRINRAKDISLGDRVWVGQRSTILKGVTIGNDSVVGAGSIVSRNVPQNCIVAGNPARIVKVGVAWKRELIPMP